MLLATYACDLDFARGAAWDRWPWWVLTGGDLVFAPENLTTPVTLCDRCGRFCADMVGRLNNHVCEISRPIRFTTGGSYGICSDCFRGGGYCGLCGTYSIVQNDLTKTSTGYHLSGAKHLYRGTLIDKVDCRVCCPCLEKMKCGDPNRERFFKCDGCDCWSGDVRALYASGSVSGRKFYVAKSLCARCYKRYAKIAARFVAVQDVQGAIHKLKRKIANVRKDQNNRRSAEASRQDAQ